MKHILYMILVLLLLPIVGWADINAAFNPNSIEVNTMAVTSFDPNDPLSQPNLTTLTVYNNGQRIDLKVRIFWNNTKLVEANFQHRNLGFYDNIVTFSNRELISNEGHPDFENKYGTDISVGDVIDANRILKEALLGGYFPDGDLEIRVWVRPYNIDAWTVADSDIGTRFIIKIRNAGAINLVSPGVAIGQTPPQISERPISFQWNSIATGFNDLKLVIREYPANNPPTSSNIESTGNLFYQNMSASSGFSDFLAFNPGNYYAWQVSTELYNEFSTHSRTPNTPQVIKSNWFVFRFVDDSQNNSDAAADIQAQLNVLNNQTLRNLIAQGYTPVGTVIYEGRTYSGQDALDILSGLVGKELQVQLKD